CVCYTWEFKKEEVIRGCVGKGENKEDKVDKKHVFWAPAPLTVKSWVDVDDEDYYAITASSPVWGVGAGKDDKVAPLEMMNSGRSQRNAKIPGRYDDSVFEVNSKKINKKNKKINKNMSNNDSQVELGEIKECLDRSKDGVNEKVPDEIQNQDSVIVEEIVQNQMDKDVIDQGKKEVSVEKEIGISSVSNDSNDGIGIDQDNEVVSDEIGNDKSNVDENKLHENNEVQNSNRSYADAIGENVINFEKNLVEVPTEIDDNGIEVVVFDEVMIEEDSKRWEKTVCAYFVGYGMSVNELSEQKSMVKNKPLIVQKWDINMCLDKTEPEVIPLWIKLCNVPLEAWTTKGLSALASRIGKPIIMDSTTASMCKIGVGRIGFARLLVEVSARKALPYDIEVVYKNGAKECGQNRGNSERKENTKTVGEEQKNKMNPKPSGNNGKGDSDGFIVVQNKKNVVIKEKVLRPNFKPNAQQSKFQPKKVNSHYEFQPKKNASNHATTSDQTELVELQEMRNKDRVEGWNSNMNKVKNREEVDDVYDDDSGIAECMKNDGVNGMDGDVLNESHVDSLGFYKTKAEGPV
ncbi:zinc knuckle CX2CX4HX4C containing protein, partial [Tanacetum coccineum]